MAKVIRAKPALKDVTAAFDYLAKTSGSADIAERVCMQLLDAAYNRLGRLLASDALADELKEIGAREIYKHGRSWVAKIESFVVSVSRKRL